VGLCLVAASAAGLRWLRVAQREHYIAGSVTRFAQRWWLTTPVDGAMAAVAVSAAVAAWWWPLAAIGTAVVVAVGPVGLAIRGRTSALRWTRRLRTLAAAWVVVTAAVVVVGWILGVVPVVAAAVAILAPLLVDVACALVAPVERRLADRYVRRASARLSRVRPTIVAITGSYGKTSTKGLVAQLVGAARPLVASPASFNNRAGLARAVNEHLADGTEVFVAEMGTYGVGEIAELCRWCPPDIAVITAVGPVHLERFGSEDRIIEAKSEILTTAPVVVLPVDDDRLAGLADRMSAAGRRVFRCSIIDRAADVCVDRAGSGDRSVSVYVAGEQIAKDVPAPPGIQPSNLACAIAVALGLGLEAGAIADQLGTLHVADHRLSVARAPSGVVVIDDTYNANPAGAAVALDALASAASASGEPGASGAPGESAGRTAVVTPGMIELGARQFEENERLGAAVARQATDLLVVGRTNWPALSAGANSVPASQVHVHRVRHRDDAVVWVRHHLGPGDSVLYENDLPDHYP
jgi:UDP-N-acetylmuramoyl-tripeptide--D-alanyl-D-alanine ligase